MLKKKKKQPFGGQPLISLLTMTLVGLWCVVSGVSWKSSGEMLAAGVEDVNAVSGLIPGFQELPGGQPQMACLVENSFLCCSKCFLESPVLLRQEPRVHSRSPVLGLQATRLLSVQEHLIRKQATRSVYN